MSRRRLIRYLASILVMLLLSALGVSVNQGKLAVPVSEPDTPPGYYHVVKVEDGDTIKVAMAGKTETVRFIGIDTPEVKDPRKPVQCFGKVASEQTHKLLDDKNVRLEPDPTNSNRDKYQRLLRYVYLPDNTFVNQYLVQNGYAFAYTVFPNTKLEEFRAWEKEAREQNRGLWAGCKVNDSSEIKQTEQ